MILAAQQPLYLSYPGTFDKMDRADVYVFLDNVQYIRRGWINRNRLRTREGWTMVTLPVHSEYTSRICEVVPVQSDWITKHRKQSLCSTVAASILNASQASGAFWMREKLITCSD